jgi:DNA uptake protein ComE-like DNA-binding protein
MVVIPLALLLIASRLPESGHAPRPVDLQLVVDPNSAPRGVLVALPRLGPVLVDRIITEREIRPFASLDDFDRRVKGIGPVTAASLAPYFKFEESEPDQTAMTDGRGPARQP